MNFTATDDPDVMRPFDFANDLYNFGPLNHYQRPERRYNLGAMGHYEFGEHADVYTQLMFNDYESIAQIAPGGAFGETSARSTAAIRLIPANILGTLGCDAAAIAANDCGAVPDPAPQHRGRRSPAVVREPDIPHRGRVSVARSTRPGATTCRHSTRRVPARQSTLNYFQIDRVAKALNVLDVGGVPTCDVGDRPERTRTACPGIRSSSAASRQEQLAYLQVKGVQVGRINQEIYNGMITGDLGVYGIKSPLASDGIQLVFGAEYRRDTLDHKVDALQEAGRSSPAPAARRSASIGSTKVKELFMEARVPIAQDQAFAESLSFDTAYRYSDYGDGIQTDTYKFGLEWAPIADVRLRGSYQRAVRAANIVELFTAQGFNLFDAPGDPCGLAADTPTRRPTRRSTRHSMRQAYAGTACPSASGSSLLDSPAGQYSFLQGGNLDLTPEESDTIPTASCSSRGSRRACDHGRLLRHRDREHDLDLRSEQHVDGVLRRRRSGRLRSHQPRCC